MRAVRTADNPQAVWVAHAVHLTHSLKSQRRSTFTMETLYRKLLLMCAAVTDCCCEPLPHLMSDTFSKVSALVLLHVKSLYRGLLRMCAMGMDAEACAHVLQLDRRTARDHRKLDTSFLLFLLFIHEG